MLWALLAFMITFALVWLSRVTVPLSVAPYLGIALVAGLDSVVGGWRASIEGRFDNLIFVTGFFFNALVAALFAYIGDIFGAPLYTAATVPFAIRIFTNLGIIRRHLIERRRAGKV